MLTSFLNNNPNYFVLPNTPAYPHGYNINADTLHLLPNVAAGVMYGIDPAVAGGPNPNLDDVSSGLINTLLSTANIVAVAAGPAIGNRFALDVTYNFPNAIPNVTQTQDIAYNLTGGITNTVKIVIQVLNGFVSVVTMYPI